MNIIDEDDKRIEAILKADIYEPDSYTQAIMTALNKKNKRKLVVNIPKLIAALIAGIMLVSGFAYAKQIEEFIRRFFNNSRGLDTAVEHGYIEEANVVFETPSDIKVELKYFTMDDNNLSFILNMKFNDDINVKDITKILIPDLLIADDLNNVLYCGNEEKIKEYSHKNKLDYDIEMIKNALLNNDISSYKKISDEDNNILQITYNLYSKNQYLKLKKLYFEFNTVEIYLENGNTTKIESVWKSEINMLDKFYNREQQKYRVIECSEPLMNAIELNVYDTSSIFELEAKLKPYYTENMPENIKKEKREEFINWTLVTPLKFVDNVYIENSHGEKFFSSESSYDNTNIEYDYNGKFKYRNTFDLTLYDITDTLTVYFTLNTIYGSEDVVIKLEKDN